MKLKHFEASHCKNLSVLGNITSISADFTSNTQVIVGDNGCGKSTILRLMEPKAHNSTLFETQGAWKTIWEDEGDTYELSSDWSNREKIHSFIKNDVELNQSGNASIMDELVVSEFGYTDVVKRLCNLQMKFSGMGKTERRSVFMSLYPSNLSFILDKQKEVSRKVREINSQLKYLYEKRQYIVEKQIEKSSLQQLIEVRNKLTTEKQSLAKHEYAMRREMNRVRSDIGHIRNDDEVKNSTDAIATSKKEAIAIINTGAHRDCVEHGSWSNYLDVLDMAAVRLSERMTAGEEKIKKLLEELQSYEAYEDTNHVELLEELQNTEKHIIGRLTSNRYDRSIPTYTGTDFESWKDGNYRKAIDIIMTITTMESNGGKLWRPATLNKANSHITSLTMGRNDIDERMSRLAGNLERERNNYETQMEQHPPMECAMTCNLKTSFNMILKNAKDNIDRLEREMKNYHHEREDICRRIAKLNNALEYPSSAMPLILELADLLGVLEGSKWVLNNEPLVSVLNQDPGRIRNRLTLLLSNTEFLHEKNKLSTELESTKSNIEILSKDTIPAKEMLDRILLDKRTLYRRSMELYDQLKAEHNSIIRKMKEARFITDLGSDAREELEIFEEETASMNKQFYVSLCEEALTEISERDSEIGMKLRSIEGTITEQEQLSGRMEDIDPDIKRLVGKLKIHQDVEKSLIQIPNDYIVNFLNNIIGDVNKIINSIWSYPMKISKISKKTLYKYNIPLTLNGSKSIKDISECSSGQKEVIDIAWSIALCNSLGLFKRYPFKLDEPDRAISDGNRARLLEVISRLATDQVAEQIVLVNHHESLYNAIPDSEIMVLDTNNIVTPPVYNEHVTIT